MKKIGIMVGLMAVFALFSMIGASAQNPVNVTGQEVSTDKFLSDVIGATINSNPGNVTVATMETNTSASDWEAFYGDFSGNLVLGDSSGNPIYSWTLGTIPDGTLLASTDATPDFSALTGVNAADINTQWSITADESAATVYTIATSVCRINGGDVVGTGVLHEGGNTIETVAYDQTGGGSKSDYIFATNVSNNQALFNGGNGEYEILLPADVVGDAWYFYAELV